jgi:hypothetical protein
VVERPLELPDPLAQRLADVRQALWAEDQESPDEDKDDVAGSEDIHGIFSFTGPFDGLRQTGETRNPP